MCIKDLEKLFERAKQFNEDVCIELTIPGKKAHEFIIVLNDNLDYKLDYYKNSYTNELELKAFNEIKIVDAFAFVFGNKSNVHNL
ncbi:MAG: hypothetical protein RR500_04040 [Bacilli bacterium]